MTGNVFITGEADVDKALADLEPKVQRKYGRKALNNSLKIAEERYRQLVPVASGAMRDAVVRRTPKGKRGQLRRALAITRDSLARSIKRTQIRGIRALFRQKREARLEAIRGLDPRRGIEFRFFGVGDDQRRRELQSAFRQRVRGIQKRLREEAREEIRQQQKASLENATPRELGENDFYPAYVELGTSDTIAKRPLRDAVYGGSGVIKDEIAFQLRKLITESKGNRIRG